MTEPAPPAGWIVATAGDGDDPFEWHGGFHRDPAEATAELDALNGRGYDSWQLYALYPCPPGGTSLA